MDWYPVLEVYSSAFHHITTLYQQITISDFTEVEIGSLKNTHISIWQQVNPQTWHDPKIKKKQVLNGPLNALLGDKTEPATINFKKTKTEKQHIYTQYIFIFTY